MATVESPTPGTPLPEVFTSPFGPEVAVAVLGAFRIIEALPTGDNVASIVASAVDTAVSNLVAGAPDALNTLNEIVTALAGNSTADTALAALVNLKMTKSANLSDLTNVVTARTNLGLGSAATTAATAYASASAFAAYQTATDARLTALELNTPKAFANPAAAAAANLAAGQLFVTGPVAP